MKKPLLKILSIVLCAALLVGCAGAAVCALTAGGGKEMKTEQTGSAAGSGKIQTSKDETVYVIAGAEGTVEKIIVSDWIKNSSGSAAINDKATLDNVQNVGGDETYTMNGDNMRVWDAQGKDIYCQGSIEKDLPVNLSISYQLDGKAVSPSDLAGRSGHVTIRFDYQNNQYEMVQIDGKNEKVYVPFVMLTGMLLDNDIFTNVEVSNGKLINDGSRMAVVGIAFPGLQENLQVSSDQFEIPNYVEINADVQNFEMSTTMSIATNEVFNTIDADKLMGMGDLEGSITKLSDAMSQLLDGSSQLYGGLCTLLDKSGELIAGIDKLADGAKALENGAGKLQDGTAELAGGLGTLIKNNDSLNGGAEQVFNSLLSTANTQLAAAGLSVPELTIENYAVLLNGVLSSLDENTVRQQANATALESVTQQVRAQQAAVRSAVTASVRKTITETVETATRALVRQQVLAGQGLTEESYEQGVANGTIAAEQQQQIDAAVDAQMNSDDMKNTVSANVERQMNSAETTALIDSETEKQIAALIAQNMQSAEVQSQITAAVEKAKAGAGSIRTLKASLDGYNEFYTGLGAYTAGASDAAAGAENVADGAADVYAGINSLYDGILTLKDGAPALTNGIAQLRDGAMQLSGGLKAFNEQGVQKLIDAVGDDLGGLLTRIRATVDVSKNYRSFSGLGDGMDGQVKFIYRTESVKAAQ